MQTPLPSRKERLGLVFQSRLHSKSGREYGLLLARLGFPAATMSAVFQRLIPPPKYDVTRLVPNAEVVDAGTLAGMIVIQREDFGRTSSTMPRRRTS